MKIFHLFIFLSALSPSFSALATYRVDMPNALESEKLLSTFPHRQAMGVIVGESTAIASAVFIDNQTAITAAHTNMLRTGERQFICISPVNFYVMDRQGNYDLTLQKLDPKAFSIYDITSFATFNKISNPHLESLGEVKEEEDFEFDLTPWDDFENVISNSQILIDNENYKMEGCDLAVLKLHKPIELVRNCPSLTPFDPFSLKGKKGYAIGSTFGKPISDGKMTSLPVKLYAVEQPYDYTPVSGGKYFSCFYSLGGLDNQFIPDQTLEYGLIKNYGVCLKVE